jgi:hypothetical protein
VGALDGDAQDVRLELAQLVVAHRAAVHPEGRDLFAALCSRASTLSFVWYAMDSRAARTMCFVSVSSVIPTIAALASRSQWGAQSPWKAGTK